MTTDLQLPTRNEAQVLRTLDVALPLQMPSSPELTTVTQDRVGKESDDTRRQASLVVLNDPLSLS